MVDFGNLPVFPPFTHPNHGEDDYMEEDLPEQESLTELLLIAAGAIEGDDRQLAVEAVTKLEALLVGHENGPDPFHRLTHYFTRSLRAAGSGEPGSPDPAAGLIFELTPHMKFAHFAANQAILEAATSGEVHVVDLDVREGIQWPSLMMDLSHRGSGVSLRITAVVETANGAGRTGRRLVEFGESVGLLVRFDELVLVGDSEKEVEFARGRVIVMANCMAYHARRRYVYLLRFVSPEMVVLVEEGLFGSSFVELFGEMLRHYSAVSESLESCFRGGMRMVCPRIVECVRNWSGGGGGMWMEGYKNVPVSSWNVEQARLLLGIFDGGYGVQRGEGRMSLCWKSRPLSSGVARIRDEWWLNCSLK